MSDDAMADRAAISDRLRKERVEHEAGAPILETKDLCRYFGGIKATHEVNITCLLYTSPSPRDQRGSRMPSSA